MQNTLVFHVLYVVKVPFVLVQTVIFMSANM